MISYPWEAEVDANIAGLLHVWHESEWAVLKPAPFIFPWSDWPNFCPGHDHMNRIGRLPVVVCFSLVPCQGAMGMLRLDTETDYELVCGRAEMVQGQKG